MHPRWRRCSSLKYSRYSRSSRLASGAPRPSRCDAGVSPRAVNLPRMRRLGGASLLIIGSIVLGAGPARAQQAITVQGGVIFYGDNTEFRNPFREGETIFGTAARAEARFDLSDRAS